MAVATPPRQDQQNGAPEPAAPRGPRRRWTLWLAVTYLAALIVVGVAARVIAEGYWLTTLLLYVPQILYAAPVPLLVLLALIARDGRALLVNGLTVLFIGGVLMGFNVPLPPWPFHADGPRIRVIAYNIHGGTYGLRHLERQIESFQPDVVVFSEALGWGNEPELNAFLSEQFPGWDFVQGGDIRIGSRWPIVAKETQNLKPSRTRVRVQGEIEAPFGRFHLVGVHFSTAMYPWTLKSERRRLPRYLTHTGRHRSGQTNSLIEQTRDLTGPVILAGDFNTPPAGRIYGRLRDRYRDAFAERGWGWGFTYPSRLPQLRIDYVFHTPEWRTVEARVGERRGSDHRPVFAVLALEPGR